MTSKKRLLSVAAAVAISSSIVGADYLPLTSGSAENKWVMFGVTGFHANGATDGTSATGAVDAGMFSIADDTANLAKDTGGDDLYGEEGATGVIADAITDGTDVLGSVKRVDGTASPVYVRVRVADQPNINYFETDPVRTIYVKQEADDTSALFAFTYKSVLEGQTLEFSTTSPGAANDGAYRITISSENTYNNPAIGEFIPAIAAEGGDEGDSGVYLRSVADAVDYDFTDGPEAPNPINSSNYLQADHQDIAAAGESIRLWSYDPETSWLLYDSRNTLQQFETLEKGKGYWGKMDLAAATPAGLVLGSSSISTQDYLDAGIAEGWNLLAFNANNADLRVATTGLVITTAAADIQLFDVSGNHTTGTITLAGADAVVNSLQINNALKQAKISGAMPKTFNLVAIPTGAATVALLSDEKFTLRSSVASIVDNSTTLAGDAPLGAVTLVDNAADGSDVISKYGEYALVVKPENSLYAELDIKCDTLASQRVLSTQGAIDGATCIGAAYDLDTDYDGAADNHILMASTEAFEIRDHTFTRVFDYTPTLEAGELTFVNADTTTSGPVTITSSVAEVQTLAVTADGTADGDESMTVTYGTNASGGTASVLVDLSAVDTTVIADVAIAITNALNADATFSALAVATTPVAGTVTITYSGETVVGLNINTEVSETTAGTIDTLDGTPGTTTDGSVQTAGDIVTQIHTAGVGFVETAGATQNIIADGTQILFRVKAENENEWRVLETGAGDNLTPSSTTNVWAKGAISDVFSPNYLVKAPLTNTITIALADTATDPVETDTVSVSVVTQLATIALEDYVLDAADEADANVFYPKLVAHINDQLDANGLETTVAIVKTTAAIDEFDATVTFTGSDVINVTAFDFLAADVTDAAPVLTLGTPVIGSGDMTEDLKFNYILSPNYVLDGPLYEMKAAGYTAKAMVTGTMSLSTDTMNWDGIDLTRKPSEWLDSQDYNLFTVDSAAGYWTYLETAEASPLAFDAANFVANYTQHFDQDGTTYNQVGGGIYINVTGIDYTFDGTESARVVAVVGGSQVELSRQSGDTYTGQISSREIQEMVEGKEYDIQVIVADGIGYRIPATSTGVSVDFKKPATPTVALNGGTMSITNDAEDGVVQYYVFNGDIPATSTAAAALANMSVEDAASYNLCGSLSRDGSYDLKIVALDGDTLAKSNVSNAFALDSFAPVFKNSAIITDSSTNSDTTPSEAAAYYNVSCAETAISFDTTKFSAASFTNNETVKVAYEPITAGDATRIGVYVDGGTQTATTALLTYEPSYIGKVVYVQLGDLLYRYELPAEAAIPVANSDADPIDLSVVGTFLPDQNLGE
ncbi:MAG: hypothetical protein RBR54_10375 [Sulfurimonas sp.]|jgi:hypothetical protein|nr:hypothetical protein [Sulfurimonas sp.]